MAKRGVWGEQMRIIVPVLYKRVTCATCIHYCHEDHSCMVSPIIPKINGFDYWKKCKTFELSPEYLDEAHKVQVIKVKGENFFAKRNEELKQEEKIIRKELVFSTPTSEETSISKINNKPRNFSERFVEVAKRNHGLELGEIAVPELPGLVGARCYVDVHNKIIVMTMPKIKSKKVHNHHNGNKNFILADLWTRFSDSLKVIIKTLLDLNCSEEYEKWIIIPVFAYKDGESCGETFYKTKGSELKGIKLVEMDETDNLMFATGPIFEKYWTAEKIRNIQIFKD